MMENFSGLTMGRVIKWNQHDNSVDCQSLYDAGRFTAVPLMCGMMTSSSGFVDWHLPEGNAWDQDGSKTRDVIAVIAKLHEQPFVIGFIAQPVSEMLFRRDNFRIDRHASDVYSTIDKDGNVELAHPSGTHVRLAVDPEHEDLTGKDWDKKWAIKRNVEKRPWVSVRVANQDGVKATVRIDPSGNITIDHRGSLTVATDGPATLTAASMTINANTVINGTVAVTGGSLMHNGVNVGGTHVHGGVAGGSSNTAVPH